MAKRKSDEHGIISTEGEPDPSDRIETDLPEDLVQIDEDLVSRRAATAGSPSERLGRIAAVSQLLTQRLQDLAVAVAGCSRPARLFHQQILDLFDLVGEIVVDAYDESTGEGESRKG